MKYAFMSFSCPELSMKDFVAVAKRYGYDGIEPRIGSGHRHGIEATASADTIQTAASIAADSGISICCLATSCKFANPETGPENIRQAGEAIALAAAVGAPVIRVFGGEIPKDMERSRSAASIAEALGALARQAQDAGVTVCLETHDDWCDPNDVADILRQVDHPSIAVNWDIMHPVLTARTTVENAFKILRPYIRHVHVHNGMRTDGKLVFLPIGEGPVDHKAAVALLEGAGYDGFISGEWIGWEPYAIHLPRELAALKSFEA